jgi:DNA-binding NarL/FixJ family response regulator
MGRAKLSVTDDRVITAEHIARVVVIDDHRTFAELLAAALNREGDLDCVGMAHGVRAGVELCLELAPDLVILDYRLPDGDGLQAAEQILGNAPTTRIVMLTGDPTMLAIQRAASVGVCGFLPKDGALDILLDVVRSVRPGEFVVSPALISRLDLLGRDAVTSGPSLTARELQVLRLMAEGQDVSTNARTLGISAHTCRGYVKSILMKLDAHSQLEAVVAATKLGLLGSI